MNVRLATTAVAAAAGALLLTVAPAATAAAPTVTAPVEQAAPNLEASFPVSVSGAEMTFRGNQVTADLTGDATVTIDAPSLGSLETKATGTLTVSAQHPDLGKITVESKAEGTATFSGITPPYTIDLDLSATGTVTVENPGTAQRGSAKEPLVLTTKNPAALAGNLKEFPPKGEFTQLANPVELVDGSDNTVASITKFPVMVGSA